MLENREQWEDVGYKVKEGDFLQGSRTVIERPAENSLTTISTNQRPDQIVQAVVVATIEDEIAEVVRGILADLEEGLRPDDILVVIVDDRHVATYINSLMESLANHDVYCNNIHSDKYGIKDFHKDGFVTLSTVHKAKGNEAYMVYVMGIDALYSPFTSVRERNVLFTAMTRAKGWVRVTGVGEGAAFFKEEIDKALMNFPNLVFDYPSREELKILKRDLTQKDIRKLHAERQLDILFEGMSQAEIETYLAKRVIKKIK
jgi:superfamily I DNA and RNA helicase